MYTDFMVESAEKKGGGYNNTAALQFWRDHDVSPYGPHVGSEAYETVMPFEEIRERVRQLTEASKALELSHQEQIDPQK